MDTTSLWVFWQKYRNHAGLIVAGAALFALGWQTGHVMSPYYTASPIVFQEGSNEDHGGTAAALEQVEQANNNLVKKQPTSSPNVSPTSSASAASGVVAGATTGPYVASKNSNLYHDTRCSASKRIAPQNLISFPTKEAASAAGFSPSVCTKTYIGQAN